MFVGFTIFFGFFLRILVRDLRKKVSDLACEMIFVVGRKGKWSKGLRNKAKEWRFPRSCVMNVDSCGVRVNSELHLVYILSLPF